MNFDLEKVKAAYNTVVTYLRAIIEGFVDSPIVNFIAGIFADAKGKIE